MKLLIFLLSILLSGCSEAQTNDAIIKALKKKDLTYVVSHSSFPFNLSAASLYDDEKITDKATLSKKFKALFKDDYFSEMLRGKRTVNTQSKITFESKQFNTDGELESESTITFYFKKDKKGGVLLYKIILAG